MSDQSEWMNSASDRTLKNKQLLNDYIDVY